MGEPLVLFHKDCWDGLCAAWVAIKFYADYPEKKVEAIPVQYGQDPPNIDTKNRNVYIVDFSYKRPIIERLHSQSLSLLVLEHHKSAQKELEGLPYCRFHEDKSGARIAWEHFFPTYRAPWIVEYIEDRDLWRWALPYSRQINADLRSHPMTFETLDHFHSVTIPHHFISSGEAILRRERQIIDDHVSKAVETTIDGHSILAVNATVLYSEVAGELAKERPFGACWFQRQDGKTQWSLRSDDNGIDVSEVAKKFGGGGHFHAAGFETSRLSTTYL